MIHTYKAHVTVLVGRTVTVQAENKATAENKAIQEVESLTGGESFGIDGINDVTPGPWFNRIDPGDDSTWIECWVHSIDPYARKQTAHVKHYKSISSEVGMPSEMLFYTYPKNHSYFFATPVDGVTHHEPET